MDGLKITPINWRFPVLETHFTHLSPPPLNEFSSMPDIRSPRNVLLLAEALDSVPLYLVLLLVCWEFTETSWPWLGLVDSVPSFASFILYLSSFKGPKPHKTCISIFMLSRWSFALSSGLCSASISPGSVLFRPQELLLWEMLTASRTLHGLV